MAKRRNEDDLTMSEAASMLGVSSSTVGKWARSGRLDSYTTGNRRYILRSSAKAEQSRLSKRTGKTEPSRRDFLAIGKKMAFAGVSGWVFFMLDQYQKFKETRVEVEDLFAMWPEVQIVPGSHHPRDGYHPDIKLALDRLVPLVRRSEPVVTRSIDSLPLPDLNRELLLIGGPISNNLSLKVHGYTYTGNKISEKRRRDTGLRWHFYYPYPRSDDPRYLRYVQGQLRQTMPKALIDQHGSGYLAQPRYCKYDPNTERLESDFLLLTVVPNTLGRHTTGSTIIDVADLQGQGDKVFAEIVRDNGRRRELLEAVHRSKYFQALYEVPVQHDDVGCVTSPGTPTLFDVHVLA